MRSSAACWLPLRPPCKAGMDLAFFRGALGEIFKGPLLILAAPALPLLLICLGAIAVMVLRELRKK